MHAAPVAATETRRRGRPRRTRDTVVDFTSSLARRLREIGDPDAVVWPSPRYQRDPVAFVRERLGVEPWSKQIEILEAVRDHKRTAVKSGHKVSKSHTAACIAWWFYSSFDDARVIMTSTTARQVDAILYRELKKLRAKAKKPIATGDSIGELARTGVKAPDFREIVGFTAREPEAVAGVSGSNLLYILDEASGIPDAIYEAIEGNRAGGACIILFSNPTRTEGEFFEAFESKSAFYHCITVSSEDTPNVREGREVIPGLATREWVEEKRAEWGEDSPLFKVRVKGEFVRNEEGKIISLHLLEEAAARWEDTPATGVLRVGLDPAGPGDGGDETVMCGRRGLKQIEIRAKRGLGAEQIVGELLSFLGDHRKARETPVVVVDREGPIGSEVYGLLMAYLDTHESAFVLIGVRSSERASREPQVYDRVRDELWANGAAWLREGGALVADDKQDKDLHAPEWVQQVTGRLKATAKPELRKALGRSPDRGDAFLLSVWETVAVDVDEHGAMPAAPRDPYEEHESALENLSPYAGFSPYGGRS